MAEYIDRDALIEHIRKDPLFDLVEQYGITGVIESFPVADVQPIVRCGECKYFSEVMFGGTQFEYGYCDRWADGTRMNPDDFCSRGVDMREGS